MKSQERWDTSKIVFHNMKWKSTTVPDETLVSTFETDFTMPAGPQPEIFPPEPVVKTPEPVLKTPEITPDEPEPERIKVPAAPTDFYFLPAIIREKKDPLYGGITRTVQYGNPGTCKGVVMENEFMKFSFWATAVLGEGAIVFPKNQDRRWWRVTKVTPKTGGWIYECVTSDQQPDFSAVQ
jgi:hypothetical protein